MLTLCVSLGCGPLGVPSLGFHPGVWLLLMAQRRFAYPAGGSFLSATERNQRAPQGLCPWESHQGVPPGSPKGWGKRPIPSYPCGAIGRSPVGGIPPPATPTGPPPSGGAALARRARFPPQWGTPTIKSQYVFNQAQNLAVSPVQGHPRSVRSKSVPLGGLFCWQGVLLPSAFCCFRLQAQPTPLHNP